MFEIAGSIESIFSICSGMGKQKRGEILIFLEFKLHFRAVQLCPWKKGRVMISFWGN